METGNEYKEAVKRINRRLKLFNFFMLLVFTLAYVSIVIVPAIVSGERTNQYVETVSISFQIIALCVFSYALLSIRKTLA